MRRRAAIICIFTVFLQACGLVPTNPIRILPSPMPSQATSAPGIRETATKTLPNPTGTPTSTPVIPTATSTRTPRPYTPTPTLTACMQAGGTVDVFEFTTSLLPDPLVYRIYLPPCYNEQPEKSYPVLYLIHGQTYSDTQWDRLGVPETADQLIRSGEAAPFIVVMPRDRVWLEPTEDNFGKAVEQSLVPWVDEHYRTIPDRSHRAIGGLSRGGAWALHIGLSRWNLFSAVGVHSGFVFYSDTQAIYQWLNNTPPGKLPRIYIDLGDNDRPEITKGATWLEDLLVRLDIPHEWHLFTGEHDEAYWQAHVEDYLRWYTMEWGK